MLVTLDICTKQHFDTRFLVFYNPLPPRMLLSLDLLSEYRIQHGTIGPLYVTSSYSTLTFCRRVSGFSTDCPCDVWCRGLTTCLLHVGPPFGNRFLNKSWVVGLTYWIMYNFCFVFWHMQLYMSWYIISFFTLSLLLKYYFLKYCCTNIFHWRNICTFFWPLAMYNPFICHIMNLLWSLSDKGTCSFLLGTKPLWHCRKWKSGSTSKRDPRPRYRPASKCSLYRYETTGQLLHSEVGSNQVGCSCAWQRSLYFETNTGATEEVPAPNHDKWDVAVHGRDLYILKPTLGPPKKFQHLTTDEEVVITRLRIGHTKATKSYILSRGPPTGCHHCGQRLTIDHILLVCALLQEYVECSLQDNSWELHSRIPARSGILLSDIV